MATFTGPDISANGLVFCIDPSNSKSYSGTGTACFDIGGGDLQAELRNGIGFNSNNGGYFTFDGSNDGIQITEVKNLSVSQMTITSWNYSTNYRHNGFMFEKTTNNNVNTQYSLFFSSGNNAIYYRTYGLSNGDLIVNTTSAGVVNNQWNYVVSTYDGSTKRIYVNGIQRTSVPATGTVRQNTTGRAYIGIYGNFGGYPFNGNISETRVYNRALNSAEILENFNRNKERFGL